MPDQDTCSHRPPCPGCPRFGDPGLPEDAWQSLVRLAEASNLAEPAIHGAPGRGHRHRARLAVRGRSRSPKIGLFQSGSHRIVDTPHCAVHHPLINDVTHELKQAIRETGTEPYADRPHRGALRYVQVVVERPTQRVQVVLVGNGASASVLGDLPDVFATRLGDRLQGLHFSAQPERTNTILGPETIHLMGEPAIRETIGGVDVFYPPAAFGQSHLPLFDRAVEQIASLVPPGSRVAEYYCGVGAIGLGHLRTASEVRFNERSPHGQAGLERGLAERPSEEQGRARISRGAASDCLDGLLDADVVVVDPPRKGLDPPLLEALALSPPRRLIYLACGLPPLLEELETLVRPGGLQLKGLAAFDFFPFTEHLETLVWLDRAGEQFASPDPSPLDRPQD